MYDVISGEWPTFRRRFTGRLVTDCCALQLGLQLPVLAPPCCAPPPCCLVPARAFSAASPRAPILRCLPQLWLARQPACVHAMPPSCFLPLPCRRRPRRPVHGCHGGAHRPRAHRPLSARRQKGCDRQPRRHRQVGSGQHPACVPAATHPSSLLVAGAAYSACLPQQAIRTCCRGDSSGFSLASLCSHPTLPRCPSSPQGVGPAHGQLPPRAAGPHRAHQRPHPGHRRQVVRHRQRGLQRAHLGPAAGPLPARADGAWQGGQGWCGGSGVRGSYASSVRPSTQALRPRPARQHLRCWRQPSRPAARPPPCPFVLPPPRLLQGHKSWVSDVAISPCGDKLVSTSGARLPAILLPLRTHRVDGVCA